MNGLLSRKENGAAGAGNTDLILPVRVRTCAEDVGRTGDALYGSRGCSQCVPVMGVTKRPAHVTSQGGVSAEVGVRASTLWAKHGIEAPARSPERDNTATLSGHFGAWRCHVKITAIHSDRMKSHAVSARTWSRASAIYKATPKGRVMRRIREAVSGSTDSWDGSRAVVADLVILGRRNAKPFLSEQARCGVDMGKLAARLKPPNGPPGPLSGNPAYPLRNVPQHPSSRVCGSIVTGDSHVQDH